MIRNYFKTAWRSLVRNKGFSAINIMGLALGIGCSLLILLWVRDERSVDNFHANGKELYQVYERQFYDGKVEASYTTQGLLADELKRVIPEIQYASSIDYAAAPGAQSTFETANKINKMNGMFAGADFFSMFSYPLLKGTPASALGSIESVAISDNMAKMFFGSAEDAIGKTIRFENKEDLKVTAVFKNLPANSSIQFDFLRSWLAYVRDNKWVNNWGNTAPNTFIQMRKDAKAAKVEAKIKDFIYNYRPKDNAWVVELGLQLYTERYLHSNFKNGYIDGGRIEYVRIFTLVAIFILLVACINFMNLATARASERAKEVGVRKVIGALRGSLITQFIGEALLFTFIATIAAVVLVALVLPTFNSLTGKTLALPFGDPFVWLSLTGLLLLTGLIAGSYPAFFLSSLTPVKVLKGSLKAGKGNISLRKALVVFQFTLSIVLIVGMVVFYKQVQYIQSKSLGYDRDNLLYIPIEGDLVNKYEVLKEQAIKLSGVQDVSKMRNSPTIIEHHVNGISWQGKDPGQTVSFADGVVGYDFVKTMKLQLKEGRDFSKQFNDSASYIVNETAINKMGLKNPVGEIIDWGGHRGKIVGVLKDFHFSSMHQVIEPLIIRLDDAWPWGVILVRINAARTKQTIAELEKLCKSINPKFPFTYQFSDMEFAKLYKSEQLVSKLATGFALLAIFISCLGLFGLAAFTAAQRRKEIGIRKVLGAGITGIAAMLSKDFMRLVAVSIIIAVPLSWWAMNKWLEGFAYRTNFSWWIFVAAGFIALMIALITVSYQAIKAALANPVNSLRSE